MSNTRKRRPTRPTSAVIDAAPARCECLHSYESDGRCTSDATDRVSIVCAVEGCDCAAEVHLVCRHCLSVWSRNATRDGMELRVRPLA
jgi:hypothetical protein